MEFEEVARYLLNLGKRNGAQMMAVRLRKDMVKQIRFSNNQIDIVKTWVKEGGSVFTVIDKKLGGSNLSDFYEADLEEAVSMAITSAKNSEPNEDFVGIYPGPFEDPGAKEYGEKDLLDDERNVDTVIAGINSALEEGAKKVAGTFYAYEVQEAVFTSEGAEYVLPPKYYAVLSLRAFYEPEISGHFCTPSITRAGLKPEEVGKEAAEIATMAKEKINLDPGTYDVVFTQMGASEIIEVLSAAFSAYYHYIGMSPLIGMLGKEVASECFTFEDRPRVEGTIGRAWIDDEGHKTLDKKLIEKGIMKGMLTNYWLSKYFGTEDTGNAGIIMPEPYTVYVEPGDYTLEEMISELKSGIVITNTWYLRFQNYRTGTFSVVPRDNAFYIEKGEIKGVARNLRVSDEYPRLMKAIKGVGKEIRQIYWWELGAPVFTPPLLVEGVRITKAIRRSALFVLHYFLLVFLYEIFYLFYRLHCHIFHFLSDLSFLHGIL